MIFGKKAELNANQLEDLLGYVEAYNSYDIPSASTFS